MSTLYFSIVLLNDGNVAVLAVMRMGTGNVHLTGEKDVLKGLRGIGPSVEATTMIARVHLRQHRLPCSSHSRRVRAVHVSIVTVCSRYSTCAVLV